jgi:hypothetical protein
MSLSDCEKCWDTPCTCGHEYRKWTVAALRMQIAMLQTVLKKKEEEEEASHAECSKCEGLGKLPYTTTSGERTFVLCPKCNGKRNTEMEELKKKLEDK